MDREIEEGCRGQPEGHVESVTLVAHPARNLGNVGGQHQGVVTGPGRPFHRGQRRFFGLPVVQLKPGAGPGPLAHVFKRARRGGRNADRHAEARGRPGEDPVRARTDQVAHSHGRDAEGNAERLSQDLRGEASGCDILQDARLQADVVKPCFVAPHSGLPTCRAVDEVEHQAGQPPPRQLACVPGGKQSGPRRQHPVAGSLWITTPANHAHGAPAAADRKWSCRHAPAPCRPTGKRNTRDS